MKNIKDVCTLIVTYNRKDYLIKLIQALLAGTYVPKKILIFDNNSTDKTEYLLTDKKIINSWKVGETTKNYTENIEILYYKNKVNAGGSGGFHDGISMAEKQKCKYIWTMDDDVLPDKDCLKNLLEGLKKYKICIPNRTDENFTDNAIVNVNMSNPFLYNIKLRKKVIPANSLIEDITEVVDMPFEGPIFETKLVRQVGLPRKDFFIIYDDSEYAYRICQKNKIGFVKNAILHKQIIPKKEKGKLMNWKNYYGYRNQYWFDKNYGKNIFVKKIRPLLSKIDLTFRAILRRKWNNIKIINAAYYDGTHNRLGKIVEPKNTFEWHR